MRWTSQANRDLRSALTYYGDRSWLNAQRFLDELGAVTERIESLPQSGHPYLNETRRVLMPNYPYGVVYRADDAGLVLVAIAHLSRRSGYWIERD